MATSAKASRVEFNDKLISAIPKHPILWDSKRKDFKEQRKSAALWAKVVTEVGCDPEGMVVLLLVFLAKHSAIAF